MRFLFDTSKKKNNKYPHTLIRLSHLVFFIIYLNLSEWFSVKSDVIKDVPCLLDFHWFTDLQVLQVKMGRHNAENLRH